MLLTAQKMLQMSYMELLYEYARPEPRLRRRLGHVGIYENASRLCGERGQEDVVGHQGREKGICGDENHQLWPVRTSSNQVQRARTFSDPQALARPKLEHQQLRTPTETAITEVSDGSDESRDSDASGSSDDGDHDDRVLCESEHVAIECDGSFEEILIAHEWRRPCTKFIKV